jgi:hypothetical protein
MEQIKQRRTQSVGFLRDAYSTSPKLGKINLNLFLDTLCLAEVTDFFYRRDHRTKLLSRHVGDPCRDQRTWNLRHMI